MTTSAVPVLPPRPPLLAHPTLRVLGVSVGLLAVAAATGSVVVGDGPLLPTPHLPWWLLAIAFAATEATVVHIQVNREARSISLSELPLVLGLFCASPAALVIGRVVGSAAVCILHRRAPALKTAFNTALFTAETCVALALFAALVPAGTSSAGPAAWPAAYVAVLVADLLGALAIALVIAVYEGLPRPRALLRELVIGHPAAPMIVTLGLVAVISLSASVASAWLLLAVGALLLVSYRAYSALVDRHVHLERLYRFSQAVSNSPEIDAVLTNVLAEAKELLHAERASAAFLGPEGALIARVRIDAGGRFSRSEEPTTAEDRWLLQKVIDGGTPQLLARATRDPSARGWLAQYGMRDGVAVALGGGDGVVGALVVADRLGDVRTFTQDDVLLLQTVANHASVALRNGELIGQLRHEALHDALTGLPNREHLQRRLATALDDVADGRSSGAAVMILDLDEFKEVNDTLGHEQGDRLLIEVSSRLTAAAGAGAVVARLGGDEFAVLLPGAVDEDRVVHVGRRLLRALERPVALDGLEVEVGGAIGVALAPRHAGDPSTLLKRADLAMHDAKTSTRRVRLYEPDLDTSNPRRLTLVSGLRAALQNGDVEVHVQPQARPGGHGGDGTVVGGEALARWEHPELGSISPDEFIPLAERSGLIGPLTTRVLDASLAACAHWRAAGHDLGISVNLSTRSLQDPDLVEEVARLLRRHGVPAARLTLEVTEGSVMANPARAVALLHQLRDLGVRLSVDDFGTGYSSLSYLKRLPVHEVKIDRSFVTGLREDGEDVAIVRAIIDLGRHLGLEVVAEGVEDQATWDLLADLGCDGVQGYHLARPMPADGILPWLTTREAAPAARGGLRAV